ncbi:MAG: hypothetical protein IPP14_08315 [Planctomycetes bacterium]|nr:hypothetical protein [Planctomycetota bacterium]
MRVLGLGNALPLAQDSVTTPVTSIAMVGYATMALGASSGASAPARAEGALAKSTHAPRALRGKGWSYNQLKAVRDMRRANPVGKPVGNVGPIVGETLGTTRYGTAMEHKMQTWPKGQYPGVDFSFQPRGLDVLAPPSSPGVPFSFAEFKPRTPTGRAKFKSQMSKWAHSRNQTRAFTYDGQGNIYVGWD